jgi:hypothetical protein
MTDNETRPHEEADSDWLLSVFVEAVNHGAGSMTVTLWVSGALVSGTLVAATEYLDGIADSFDEATGDATLGDIFRKQGDAMREDLATEGEDAPRPWFIHLKGARTFAPGGPPIPANRGVWWRGRLDAVDAWYLGLLSPAE